jgi:hypothetical protein
LNLKPLIYFVALMTVSLSAWANKPVPECKTRPEFFTHGKILPSIKALPHLVLIGQRAIYYAESKAGDFRLWGEQSFVKGQSRIVCASIKESPKETDSQSFSIYAPTLIDLSGDKSIGDSYWQFHMIANPQQFGIWNKKSRLFPKTTDLESGLLKIGAQVQVIQISKDQFEIQFIRETEKMVETLSVRFDAVADVP